MLHRLHGAPCSHTATLILRVALGIIFVMAGAHKVFGDMSGFTAAVEDLGFPAPAFFAWAAALTEFIGGIALILGLATPAFAILGSIVMLVAFFGPFKGLIPDGNLPFLCLAVTIALIMMGPGKYSLDWFMCKKWCQNKKEDNAVCDLKGGCCKN